MSLNDFEFGTTLGKGAFGSVSIVKRKEDQQIYAMKRVKMMNLNKKEKDNSFNEVRILASLRHKNIIGYKEAFFDEKSSTLNIVMEYADDGDLSSKIKDMLKKHLQFEENTIWSILIQILEGLNYLHKSSVIHRDLKSANIFLTKKGEVKIGDLNVSIIAKKDLAVTQTGTPYYAAPEVWDNEKYNNKCDIWSVGCIIYEMASLHVPFRGTSIHQLYRNIIKGKYQEIPNIYSVNLRNIIRMILTLNPLKRPSAQDLLDNEIIVNKIKEIGLINGENKEKAMLMKTIKIPKNISKINLELPKKQYSKDKNIEQMMENDEYETAKQTFYRPESAGKIVNSVKKFIFDVGELRRNDDDISVDYKKMKTLNEKQIIGKLLKEKNGNNTGQNKDNNNTSNITNLDENISNKDNDKNANKDNKDNEYKSVIFNSSIPECIQGTVLFKKDQNEDLNEGEKDLKEKEKKPRKLSYEQKEVNKFSNIDYDFGETNNNINNLNNNDKDNDNDNDNINNNNNKNDNINNNNNNDNINNNNIIANINSSKNKKDKKETEEEIRNLNEKISKIKSSIDNLIIQQSQNKNIGINILEPKTVKKEKEKEKSKNEVINTEPVNINKDKRRFSDTKNCYAFIKKNNINVGNIRNLYMKEKTENVNNINNRIRTLDNNYNSNQESHRFSNANEILPKIRKETNTISTNQKVGLKFKNRSNLNYNQKEKSNSFLLDKNNKNININMNKIIEMKNNINKNNILFPKNTELIPIEKKINKKDVKIELNKLNIIANEKEKEKDNFNIKKKNETVENVTKVRPQSVKFKNTPKLRPISSRQYNNININIEKINSSPGKEQNKDNKLVIPIIPDNKNNKNVFTPPTRGEYKLFYNHYFQNFLNLKSDNYEEDNKDKVNIPLFFNKANVDKEEKRKRKIIYEKIKIEKKGEETKYNKGSEEVRYVGLGNNYNRFNIVLSKYPNLLKINNDYGIQYFSGLNKNKSHKDGPMMILPNKMIN